MVHSITSKETIRLRLYQSPSEQLSAPSSSNAIWQKFREGKSLSIEEAAHGRRFSRTSWVEYVASVSVATNSEDQVFCDNRVSAVAIIAGIISGVAVGILSSISLIMVGEISPIKIRDVQGVLYFALFAAGFVLESILEYICMDD